MSGYFTSLLRQSGVMPHRGEGREEASPGLEVIHETREATPRPLDQEQPKALPPRAFGTLRTGDIKIEEKPATGAPRSLQESVEVGEKVEGGQIEPTRSELKMDATVKTKVAGEEIPSVRIGEREGRPQAEFQEQIVQIASPKVDGEKHEAALSGKTRIRSKPESTYPIEQTEPTGLANVVARTKPTDRRTPQWNEALTEVMHWVADESEGEGNFEVIEASPTRGAEVAMEILPQRRSSQVVVREVKEEPTAAEPQEQDFYLSIGAINLTVEAEPQAAPAPMQQPKPEPSHSRSRLRRHYL